MRSAISVAALGLLAASDSAAAATFVVYTDPMSLSRRTVVYDTPGPDRAFICMGSPGEAGCTEVALRPRRSLRGR